MKKVSFVRAGLVAAAVTGMVVLAGQSNAVAEGSKVSVGSSVRISAGNLKLNASDLAKPRSLSNIVIPKPTFSPIVIPEGADEKATRECGEAKKAAEDRVASYDACVSGYQTRYESSMSPAQASAFMAELGISDANDFYNASKVAAKIAQKCQATATPSMQTVLKELGECFRASSSLKKICDSAQKALTAQKSRKAKLEADLAAVNALIAANEKEVKDNSCGSK